MPEELKVTDAAPAFRAIAETRLEFTPTNFTQSAGLIAYYDLRTHFYLRVTHDESKGKVIGLVLTDAGNYDELTASEFEINAWPQVHLRADIDHGALRFSASPDGKTWRAVGPTLDASKLSDDYAQGFTGAMIGLCAQDLGGLGATADFDYFFLVETPA